MTVIKYIPSLLTIINLSCGLLAILVNDLALGSYLVIAAIFFDTFDGMSARALNAQSAMGKELDSLSDIVSFGVAPSYLYFNSVDSTDPWTYFAALLLIIGSALRLAKFNILPSQKYFTGLATPAMAFFVVGVVLAYNHGVSSILNLLDHTAGFLAISILMFTMMLSPLKMFSLKRLNEGIGKNLMPLACLVSFLILLYFQPYWAIPVSVLIYIVLSVAHHIQLANDNK